MLFAQMCENFLKCLRTLRAVICYVAREFGQATFPQVWIWITENIYLSGEFEEQ